jgi:hypothetical protein
MPIQTTSTTDSPEAVQAALGDLAQDQGVEDTKSASAETADEIVEASDASEATDGEEKEEKSEEQEDSDDESQAKDEDKPKKRGGFKKRIDKLSSKLSQKEQEVEYWRKEALRHQKSEEPQAKSTPLETTATEGKPKSEDFESHEAYVEALTDWKIDQRDKVREAKQKETQVKTEFQKQVDSHLKRVEAFASQHEDFHDLLEDVDDIPMSVTVQEVILSSENGPELMYELAKNRAELERICRLPAIAAARELGKFEAKLKSSEAPTEIKKTKAPAPITTVSAKGSGSVKKSIYDPNLSQREFEELREAQLKARRA